MNNQITVTIFKTKQRPNYLAQWTDPTSGRKKTRSTGTPTKREAERWAGKLESELNSGKYHDRQRTEWKEFRKRYEAEVLPGLADNTGITTRTAMNAAERIINPGKLASIDTPALSKMSQRLREEGKTEPTIKTYLTHLMTPLRWAKRQGMLNEVPHVDLPKRVRTMKGRPITAEELDRMLSKTGSVVGEHAAESWQFVQRGLWWSGLRLGEALNLHWTDDSRLCVDFSGRRPMFRIRADAEKGNKERVLPMAPEFAELLDQIPPELREGHVFNPKPMKRQTGRLGFWTVSTRIASIGRAAAVKVAQKGDKAQFASAHDLRRAFGFRWSRRVMPAVLQELMRHETISTTMEFYVGQNAEATADVVWAAVAKQSAKRDELHSWKSSDQSTETL